MPFGRLRTYMKNKTISIYDMKTSEFLTVLECRALLATIFAGPLPRAYRGTLKNLAIKVAHGADEETPNEILYRQREDFGF